ncbi:type I-E CRISPR-associated protein Cas6/Cse3/CasE [Microbacterium halotolerans]|uniref:type I-E CRISPR-associated protein Cas6/Cse3/CasE n=1 Tax=Microbacterium halotolerans TaxID=246613 RepID=UPI000E6AB2F9|nr:type I-E CRISPR-associated protein Cas6/Cse3/CasE [Microbacterium halotolerans]
MFFSHFQFNPARRGAQRLLSSPHALHAAVLAGFPDPSATMNGRVLWRLDNSAHVAKLFIVSPTQPDLTHLAEQGGWPTLPDSWGSKPYEKLLDRVANDQRYRFRLTANPVHNERRPDGQRGKPRGHVTVAQQEKWLLDRQERHGFAISELPGSGSDRSEYDVVVRDRKLLVFHRRETKVTLRTASYEGTLTVTDREAFVASLCLGIGRAKGYGCGLLTVAPVM